VQYLVRHQQPDGAWQATWYAGPAYATGMVMRLLNETGLAPEAGDRALRFLLDSQLPDGCWSSGTSGSLQTALSLIALAQADRRRARAAVQRGTAALLQRQLADGSWQASPWIRMEIGRAQGRAVTVATHKSVSITTAYGLRAMTLALADD
jgi:squalene-hopene/tetraprenyl-beta-curcumene cyclase